MLRGRSSILFYSVDSVDTIIARTSCSLVAAVSCCSPGLRLVLMLYVLPLQTHARVSSVYIQCGHCTTPDHPPVMHQIHHARSRSRSTAVLCPLSSLHPASPDWRRLGLHFLHSAAWFGQTLSVCLELELEILHNNKSELKPTEVFVPICHWWLGFL